MRPSPPGRHHDDEDDACHSHGSRQCDPGLLCSRREQGQAQDLGGVHRGNRVSRRSTIRVLNRHPAPNSRQPRQRPSLHDEAARDGAIYRSRSLMPGEWVTFWMRQTVAKLREATRHQDKRFRNSRLSERSAQARNRDASSKYAGNAARSSRPALGRRRGRIRRGHLRTRLQPVASRLREHQCRVHDILASFPETAESMRNCGSVPDPTGCIRI
jgi:hypothetical protein